jgi:hypothetical protein
MIEVGRDMKKPSMDDIKAGAESAYEWAKENGEPIARQAVDTGHAALKTKAGKRFAKGALAGAAIGYALPFVTITGCAILGGGLMLFWKTLQDKDPDE